MATEHPRRWCLFTSAGDRNSIRLWLDGNDQRRWDFVVAYYGDSDQEFAALAKSATHAFRQKGGKFQNLKKLVEQNPQFFAPYSHVFVCDDDIQMSPAQIEEAFAITETMEFWVAQPAFRPEGKISYWINCCAGPLWDYRIVNYVEVTAPIFRRDKLIEFLDIYDGSLVGWGVDYWYANVFQANDFARFAIIDKVPVTNPRDEEKGGREIDRLQSTQERRAAWAAVRLRLGLTEFPHKVFSYSKLAAPRGTGVAVERPVHELPPELQSIVAWLVTHRPAGWHDAGAYLRGLSDDALGQVGVYLARGLTVLREHGANKFHRLAPPHIAFVQSRAGHRISDAEFRAVGADAAAHLGLDAEPTFAVSYAEGGAIAGVRFARFAPAAAAPAPAASAGRNDPCPCGSGRKFRYCHGAPQRER
jgi:hypothetical protein